MRLQYIDIELFPYFAATLNNLIDDWSFDSPGCVALNYVYEITKIWVLLEITYIEYSL